MNSILKSAAKIIVELSQLCGKNDTNQDEMQHTKERLGEVLEETEKQSNAWAVHKEYG